jgi:hypothetical protein
MDLINQKCQPAPAFERRGESFHYDRERIGRIDRIRQDIVHRMALSLPIQNVEGDLAYLEATMDYMVHIVSHRYRLRIDHEVWMRHRQVATSQPGDQET